MPIPGEIGRFRITAELGGGTLGRLYRAIDTKNGNDVAITELRRLPKGLRTVMRMRHPHIGRVYGLVGNVLVQQYVGGRSMRPGDLERALPQLLDAIRYAHRHGVWHLAIRPSNLRISAEGDVTVLGFGLVMAFAESAEGAGYCEWPQEYLAPEQFRRERVGAAADLWALGCVLYELVMGQQLMGAPPEDLYTGWMPNMEWEILEKTIGIDAVPQRWRGLVRGCLQRDPDRRFLSG